ncbi:undecaprenyldiphospho-muramoylpentapeptide beta-N-acetylglucosaminyltransferase [Xylanibacillus composti]|uniref:UDP-N-acetylglucosamine--N-acetylmuramyl-(pentapeptide) pyrophosphoryl-undecaprenol N-acetylglucosamine transferase n=1 Tax=Xylanibacillus composti TaxID=1572762 RepID=A0A8J4M1K8_9BACL|nr:undecaprenyldiphospho-muramoylpentapeptide beta-N-acetylglucosaminyltransferase [Xylanibacillus composti]MDT9724366.1 undecaprenyldiphospho-muramoylpentapeptide beta-N-acetylglucosaminyltransferase [Xylanibacillus composti]GIQ67957.1 UDP-N-acetylglucosamine--N-acetylmuramyl-(pentapeptide) pyrophosphoryl-undecaprenol N-acetylglucosamine transferase 1 [Xylanibacillus composti]
MRIVLTGGGTGGHIYPALAIARHCLQRKPSCEFLYIGSNRGLEKDIVPQAGFRFESVEISGFRRKLSLDNLKTVIRFWQAVGRSKKLLREFQPDVVVGTGGYVCGPVIYAAAKLGIPTLLHEQNAVPGLTNRFLSARATVVAVSFPGNESAFPKAKKAVYTGNPRATEVTGADPAAGRSSLGLDSDTPLVVVVGGSGGARSINTCMAEMADRVRELPGTHFLFITGKAYYDNTAARIAELGEQPNNLTVVPYVDRMPDILAATSLIVTRSGASFMAEITALGIPSVQIPSPYVTNNHQEANARSLQQGDAAEVILESELTGERLFDQIRKLIEDPIRREYMAGQAKKFGQPDAAERIYQHLLAITAKPAR